MNAKGHLAALCLLAAALPAPAAEADLARNLAASCANCHGTDGRSRGGIESLAGEPQEKLLRKLEAFRSGAKPATVMQQITRGYTAEELALIAGYFAAQRP